MLGQHGGPFQGRGIQDAWRTTTPCAFISIVGMRTIRCEISICRVRCWLLSRARCAAPAMLARVPGLVWALAGRARAAASSRAQEPRPERAILASPRRMSTGCWPTIGASIRHKCSESRRCWRRCRRRKNLTIQEREQLAQQLEDLRKETRTKEQQLAHEKKQLEEQLTGKISWRTSERPRTWETSLPRRHRGTGLDGCGRRRRRLQRRRR